MEHCFRTSKTLLNPIIDWEDDDVWEYLNNVVRVEHCELYDQGYTRLGCIGCPMAHNREAELDRYPKYKAAYLRAFGRMIEERRRRGKIKNFASPEAVMDWYLEKIPKSTAMDGQMTIEELMDASEVE